MSSKLITFVVVALILFSTISHAARPEPASHDLGSQHEVIEDEMAMELDGDDSCEGIGEDECLMRRTLAARTDYLYTQKQKP